MKNRRVALGPTSPRGIYSRSMAAPGTSLDMPDEKPVKKMAGGGMAASKMGAVKTAAPSRDGVAVKGKTKGKMVVMSGSSKGMKKGGMAKGGYC